MNNNSLAELAERLKKYKRMVEEMDEIMRKPRYETNEELAIGGEEARIPAYIDLTKN